jgi:hypothetical protein
LTPAKIFNTYLSDALEKSYFRIIDHLAELSVVDLEISNYLILPSNMQLDECYLEKVLDSEIGCVFVARKAGITSAHSSDGKSNYFIRIQKQNYIGFAEYRHFEN